jgi:hypothetical protein
MEIIGSITACNPSSFTRIANPQSFIFLFAILLLSLPFQRTHVVVPVCSTLIGGVVVQVPRVLADTSLVPPLSSFVWALLLFVAPVCCRLVGIQLVEVPRIDKVQRILADNSLVPMWSSFVVESLLVVVVLR